ncbi:hypothetical protein J6590_059400 [Homalodisca vitripennis]|nr:hypothetical protein J6590_059400 [Homalodisca vitripennis]
MVKNVTMCTNFCVLCIHILRRGKESTEICYAPAVILLGGSVYLPTFYEHGERETPISETIHTVRETHGLIDRYSNHGMRNSRFCSWFKISEKNASLSSTKWQTKIRLHHEEERNEEGSYHILQHSLSLRAATIMETNNPWCL